MIKRLPATTKKVCLRTDPKINEKIREQTLRTLKYFQDSDEKAMGTRIRELNQEWDTQRVLETHAASMIILCSLLGILKGRFWYLATGMIGVCLLRQALEGWCPSLPVVRRMEFRTSEEINLEKTVLKVMRGDFTHLDNNVENMLSAAEKQ